MDFSDKSPYKHVSYVVRYEDAIKRKKIDETLNKLHTIQLDMIDELVDQSNLSAARDVISRIMKIN